MIYKGHEITWEPVATSRTGFMYPVDVDGQPYRTCETVKEAKDTVKEIQALIDHNRWLDS